MKQENEIKDLLLQINTAENNAVAFDEAAIISEYRHKQAEKSSLAIKILTILGGFLASLAFLGFFTVAGLYKSGTGSMIFGLVSIVAAIWLNKAFDRLIIDTFSISLFACGLLLIGIGASQAKLDENIIPLVFILIGFCALFITQNYILSFISVLVVSGSILWLIYSHSSSLAVHAYMLIATLIMVCWFLAEAKIISSGKKLSKLYNPVRMGLVVSFIAGLCLHGVKEFFTVPIVYPWISSIITISGVWYIVFNLCKRFAISVSYDRVLIYVMSLVILAPTVMAPAIPGSILIILLCFLVNFKTGIAMGILSLIYFAGQYYYDLGFNLLTKSWMMMATGILFLLIYLITYKKLGSHEKV